jgi:hypothetical protein
MKTNEPPKFRDKIPIYLPPDREQWSKENAPPVNLGSVREVYVKRAQAACENDGSVLSGEQAIKVHGVLDEVCDHVHADLNLPESTLVFFDPKEKVFWAYPRKT